VLPTKRVQELRRGKRARTIPVSPLVGPVAKRAPRTMTAEEFDRRLQEVRASCDFATSDAFDRLGSAIRDLGAEFRRLGEAHNDVCEGTKAAIQDLRESSAKLERTSKRNFARVREAEQTMNDDFTALANGMEALVLKLEKEAALQDIE
jgi:hypothetical protein